MGYSVSNVVRVRLDDLRNIGPVIDAATQAGSNNVRNVRFALRDDSAARNQALRQAALSARRDADTLAGALGLRVVRVLAVEEQSGGIRQPLVSQQANRWALPTAPTPVEAGTVDINAAVTLTVEVAAAKR